jgi:hypothetical protein
MFLRVFFVSLFFVTLRPLTLGQEAPSSEKGEEENRVEKTIKESIDKNKTQLPDSSRLNKRALRKHAGQHLPDSLGATYENGKWVLPQAPAPGKPQAGNLKINAPDGDLNMSGLSEPDWNQGSIHAMDSLSPFHFQGIDSLLIKSKKITEGIGDSNKEWPEAVTVYSAENLKKQYDSLGLNRLDSLRALAASKREVSPQELLQVLNQSFKSEGSQPELSQLKAEAIKEGQEGMELPDLSSLKLPSKDNLEFPPMRGFQLPKDSLGILDSLRKIDLARGRLGIKERELREDINSVSLRNKPGFWNRSYFETLIAYHRAEEFNLFQFSPALGYHLYENLSVGVGPTVTIRVSEKRIQTLVDYRVFAKYELFSQRAYLQAEDLVAPRVMGNEYFKNSRHSVLTGGGVLLPVSGKLALNVCVLYRVNNRSAISENSSPWVIRLGMSTIKSNKTSKSL